ncbi:MAG: hypothetical protein QT08_C0009G0051 [archaeon GW2011_AR17]|nr:MAG: hypothetical protein QT08_C0009G0051 [archaeon GW2011_AR17]MBS3154158.1 hypothetical protein [Candidatus Woesearchaeota archaeon]HIH14805.1 hypothetical protein [Nanoarchaeota archaeon]HIH59044.1 hypothetical protein [Nanoarchaeota archaeon]HII14432.1 hypothetical protein [Nanoarchaeota archaeon]
MKQKAKYILAVAGVTGTIFGIGIAIPGFMQNLYTPAIIGTILIFAGLVTFAISFGE